MSHIALPSRRVRTRSHDPVTGRWLSNDPIGISGGLNQYVFCANNPVNFVDPDGQLAWLVSGAFGGLVDAGLQVATGMAQGQSFSDSVGNINWGSVSISAVASGAGYGLLSAVDKANDAYRLIEAGRSAAQLTYTVSKGGMIAPGIATQIVKDQIVKTGTAQLTKTVGITVAVQATKKVVKSGCNEDGIQK